MKKLFFTVLLLISFNVFSQSSTQKWNSSLNRYEFFDSRGNMTAYKQYNNYLKQWETFNINNSRNSGFEQTQVRSQFNAELAERTVNSLQDRYDNNYNEIQNYATYIKESIKSKLGYPNGNYNSKDINFINMLVERFNNETLNPIWQKSYDYSDNSLKDAVKQVMRNGAASIIKEVVCCPPNYKYIVDKQEKESKNLQTINAKNALLKFVGNHQVKSVLELKYVNGAFVLIKEDNTKAEINFQNDHITFRRSFMIESRIRTLTYMGYHENRYAFNSKDGMVFISDDFKEVSFFDPDDSNGNITYMYKYIL